MLGVVLRGHFISAHLHYYLNCVVRLTSYTIGLTTVTAERFKASSKRINSLCTCIAFTMNNF